LLKYSDYNLELSTLILADNSEPLFSAGQQVQQHPFLSKTMEKWMQGSL